MWSCRMWAIHTVSHTGVTRKWSFIWDTRGLVITGRSRTHGHQAVAAALDYAKYPQVWGQMRQLVTATRAMVSGQYCLPLASLLRVGPRDGTGSPSFPGRVFHEGPPDSLYEVSK